MGTLAGFVVGFLLGTKAGPDGLEELRKAWEVVSKSEEFQSISGMALGYLQNAFAQNGTELVNQLQSLLAGGEALSQAVGNNGDDDLIKTWQKISASQEFQMLLASGTAMLGGVLAQGTAAFTQRSH